jgi:hypothetical protein
MVARVRERLAVREKKSQNSDEKSFDLRKLNELEVGKQ